MVNYTDVNGLFIINAKNYQTIKDLIHLMKYLEESEYCTYFGNVRYGDNQYDKMIIQNNDNSFEFTVQFCGTGRGEYIVNIKNMTNWILNEVKENEKPEDYEMLARLINENYSIEFDYVDYGGYNEFLHDMVVLFEHHAGNPFNINDVYECERDELELTIVNYASRMDHTFDETMEELYLDYANYNSLDKEEQDEIMTKIKPQIAEIEEYFGKPFDDLMKMI